MTQAKLEAHEARSKPVSDGVNVFRSAKRAAAWLGNGCTAARIHDRIRYNNGNNWCNVTLNVYHNRLRRDKLGRSIFKMKIEIFIFISDENWDLVEMHSGE